jgi:hypothetical protein
VNKMTSTWFLLFVVAVFVVGLTTMTVLRAGAIESETTPAWIANPGDCICGLDDPRLVSNPALVDYARVLNATPEMKKMRDKGIDPNSPAGIQLKSQATDRVRGAADKVRAQNGYCSVWKAIRHRDGRVVPDVTALVTTLL